jgi:hypothetical protein
MQRVDVVVYVWSRVSSSIVNTHLRSYSSNKVLRLTGKYEYCLRTRIRVRAGTVAVSAADVPCMNA